MSAVLTSSWKDVLALQHSSFLIESFRCVCGLWHIGRTNQRLDLRIKQHVLTKIWKGYYFADRINNTYRSSIAEHLINNHNCASSYSADLFIILSKSNSDSRLKVLKTIHIHTHKLSLSKQRECLLGLNLITIWFTPPFSKQLAFFSFPPLHYKVPAPCPFLIICPWFSCDQWKLKLVSCKILFFKNDWIWSLFKYNKMLYPQPRKIFDITYLTRVDVL